MLRCGTVVLRYCGAAVLRRSLARWCPAVLRCCGAVVLRYCGAAVLRCCGPMGWQKVRRNQRSMRSCNARNPDRKARVSVRGYVSTDCMAIPVPEGPACGVV